MKRTDHCNFRLTISLLLTITLLCASLKVPAQSIEVGYVKEYNGAAAKTPIEGVELSVKGAPSTVTDKDGRYELHFAVLKPGESVTYNDIYKSGYVIFNQDALEYWRISNSRKDFIIVMCKEQTFRELKKKYYNIIDRSYRKEYESKLAKIKEKYANDRLILQQLMAEAQLEYDRKLSDINNYVELFARIDESEMDDKTALALKCINEGKIDEGIRIYEELELQKQTELQLDKLKSGENMVTLGQQMIDESVEDLISLAGKLQKQVGLYSMGGYTYNKKAESTAESIVAVYRKLNDMTQGTYNEKLGQWLCFVKRYAEAAALPSIWGLRYHSLKSKVLVIHDRSYLDSLKNLYLTTMEKPHASDSLKDYCQESLANIPDFGYRLKSGDTIYIKVLSENKAGIYPITDLCYNRINSSMLEVPAKVSHNGRTYTITGLAYNAFRNNRNLRYVKLPSTITSIGNDAFAECDSLHTIVMPKGLETYGENAVPTNTYMILPEKLTRSNWIFDRLDALAKDNKYNEIKQLTNELKRHKTFRQKERALALDYYEGISNFETGDTLKAISILKKWVDKGEMPFAKAIIGDMYFSQGKYSQAYHYIDQAMKDSVPQAFNLAAYFYAYGYTVERNFSMAHKLINTAIRLSNGEANFYDSKGEFYLLEGDTVKARILHNKVKEVNPYFYNANRKSLLHDVLTANSDSLPKSNSRLEFYLNLIKAISLQLYSFQYNTFKKIEYEEMLAIGIIAIQGIIENKSTEQLQKIYYQYIVTAISAAIIKELKIRYNPWYTYAYNNYYFLRNDFSENNNPPKISTREYIYRSNYGIRKYVMTKSLSHYFRNDSAMKRLKQEVDTWCSEVDNAIETLPEPAKQFMKDMLNTPTPLVQLLKKYNMTTADFEKNIDVISKYLKAH